MKKTYYVISGLLCIGLMSCGGHKSDLGSETEEQTIKVEQVFPAIGLYFGTPTSMFGRDSGYEIAPSNLPDFVTYKNDLEKMGLRGKVKEVKESVSTFQWTYTFNPEGNLVNYQFRMDSRGRYGEGAKAEYNEAGQLILLGRNFRGQSPNSHTYVYDGGRLVRRSSRRGERVYYYHDSNGTSVPDSSVTKGLTPYLNLNYVERNGMVLVAGMSHKKPSISGGLHADMARSEFVYAHDGRLTSLTTLYEGVRGYKAKTLYGLIQYTYNEQGDVETMESYLFTDKKPLTDNTLLGQAVHHGRTTYEYKYDEQGNWVYINQNDEPKPKNTVSLNTMSRTITYYSEGESQ